MSKKIALMITAYLLATHSYGQSFGLPIATSAEEGEVGDMAVSGGVMVGQHFIVLGGRYAHSLMDEAVAFGGAGILFPDRGDAGLGLQVGGQYTLPLIDEILVDVAPRVTLGYSRFDYRYRGHKDSVNVWMLTAGGVVSYALDEMFTPYAFIGINNARYSHRHYHGSRVQWDPALALGVLFHFAPGFSAYAEVMHVDDPWIGLGVRYDM